MSRNAQAVKKLNEAKAQRQAQLAQAYEDLGGSNPAYKPIQQNNVLARPQRMSATIPQLEKAVMEQYENPGKPQVGNTGNIATDLSGYKGAKLNQSNLQQTYAPLYEDIRNRQLEQKFQQLGIANASQLPEAITMPTIMGQTNGAYGRPTPEMAALGITQDDIQRYLDPQYREKREENTRQLAESLPILATGASIVSRPIESTLGTLQQIGDYVTGSPMRPTYTPANLIRETVSDNIDSNVGRVAYGGVTSVGDMAMALALGKIFGGTNNAAVSNITRGLMGTEIANDAMNSAVERGLNPDQAAVEGTLYALASYLTEKGPIDKMLAGSGIFKSAAREGIQEGLEDLVDTIFDQAVTLSNGNVDRSELAQTYNNYLGMGLSEAEAKRQTVVDYGKQLGIDALLGAITGGLMQGGANAVSGRNVFSGNLNQNTQDQVIEQLKNEWDDSVTAENYNNYAQMVEDLKEQIPGMDKAFDSHLNDVSKQIVSDVKSAGDVLLAHPDVDAYNTFVQNVEQLKNTIPSLEKDFAKILDKVESEFSVLNSQDVNAKVDNVKTNVDNVKPNIDIPVINPQTEVAEPHASRRDVNNAVRTAEGIRDNLKMFNSKTAQTLEAKIDKAVENVRNSSGQAQIQAISDLNNAVAEVNTAMQGEQLGMDERSFNRDMWQRMKNVTDGRKIIATPEMLRNNNLTLDELNDKLLNTGANRIRAYSPKNVEKTGAVSLDSIWNEMVEQSNGELPNASEGDQLQALIDYVNAYKTKKGDEINTTPWEDLQTDFRSDSERQIDDITEDLFDKIEDGTLTNKEWSEANEKINEIQKKDPAVAEKAYQVMSELYNAKREMKLDKDIRAIKTPEQAQQALDNEASQLDRVLAMKLDMFAEGDTEIPTLEDKGYHSGNYKTSKFATNSFPNSGIMSDEEIIQNISDENKQYETVTHEGTYNKATENLKRNGYTNELNDLMNRKGWDAVDIDEAMLCAMKSSEEARRMAARGVDSKEAWKKTVDIFKKIRSEATRGGQMINDLKKWSSKTPEGKLGQAIAFAKDASKDTVSNDKWVSELDKVAKDSNVVFTDEFMQQFLEKAHQFDDQEVSIEQEERLNQELAHMVLDQVPKKFRDKFTSLWMDNLLASFRTLFTRNVGGNVGKFALDQTITKAFSGPIDELMSRLSGTRTTTGFTGEGFMTAMKGLREGAFNTTRDYWAANADPDTTKKFKDIVKEFDLFADANVSNRPGEEGNFRETLKNNRSAFETKAFKLYDKFIKFGLAFSDNPFYTAVYRQTLYELDQLKNSGRLKLPEGISDAKFEQWAKSYATAQGLEAVYQNDTKMSKGATKIKQGLGEMSEGYLGVDVVSGMSMPFVRTPMNVILTNLEYSPLGIAKNLIYTIREISTNLKNNRSAFDTKSFNQSRFVRETSRNLVGMLMFAAGLALKNAGLLTGGYSKNPKEKQAQKEAGMQEYAFVNPFNGNQYSINWIPALGSNLVSASAFEDAFSRPDQSTLDALTSGVKEGSASMFEMAALQGLQRLTGSANYNSENTIVDNAAQTVANTASSAIVPSFVRQMAAAIDPYKRNTYTAGGYESILNNAIAGIPFLRQTLQPRVGSNGQPLEQNAGRNVLQKWFDNLINPAMVTVPSANYDPVREEAMRLYGETRNYDAFQPEYDRDYLEVNGFEPTTEDYTEFWSRANSAMNSIASDVIQSEYYQSLSDERKEDMLASIYSLVKQGERARYLNLDTSNFDGDVMAYLNSGEEGLVDYLTARDALDQLGLANNENNRNAVLAALERSGQGSFPDILSNFENNRSRAWHEFDIGGPLHTRYGDFETTFFDDEQYENLANDISSVIRRVEANRAIGYDRDYDGADKAYYNGGVNGLLEYLYPATLLKQSGMENNEKNRQMILDAYTQGGSQAVQQQLNQFSVFSDTGYGPNLSYKYNHATNYLPQLTPTDFADLYGRIDQQNQGESGYNNITQQEVIDFLNQNPSAYNSDTALQYWYAFDGKSGTDDAWKKIPVLNPSTGMWEAQR